MPIIKEDLDLPYHSDESTSPMVKMSGYGSKMNIGHIDPFSQMESSSTSPDTFYTLLSRWIIVHAGIMSSQEYDMLSLSFTIKMIATEQI